MTLVALRRHLPAFGLAVLLVLIVAACAPVGTGPSGSPGATPEPTPLIPAQPGADPISLLSWLFTPVFQLLFILLAWLYTITKDIGIAIVLMTLIIRAVMIPLFRRQTVSQRRMQLLAPEIREVQKRYKGDRAKISQQTMALYRDRGVNPAAGCLPLILQFILLIPMYSVIQNGLTNYDPRAMLNFGGIQVVSLDCQNIANGVVDKAKPCIDTVVDWLAWLPKATPDAIPGDVSRPEILFALPLIGGLSLLAVISGLLQLVQSRMMMPPRSDSGDTQANVQRQTMLIFPLISIAYGAFLPAGLFIYWIVTTLFSIIQQYLIVGWGSMFPFFGRTPGFAVNHTPRFPVAMPTAGSAPRTSNRAAAEAPRVMPTDRAASAAATVRPSRERGRQSRRGRRR